MLQKAFCTQSKASVLISSHLLEFLPLTPWGLEGQVQTTAGTKCDSVLIHCITALWSGRDGFSWGCFQARQASSGGKSTYYESLLTQPGVFRIHSKWQELSHSHTCDNNKIKLNWRAFLATILVFFLLLSTLSIPFSSTLGDKEGCVYKASCRVLEHPWVLVCVAILPGPFPHEVPFFT